jgi:hypothetical protein
MESSMRFFDLLEACHQTGCPICRLLQRDSGRFIDALTYEYSLDQETHRQYRASYGLCADHAARLSKSGHALNVAVLTAAALDEALDHLERLDAPRPGLMRSRSKLAQELEPRARCMACEQEATSLTHYLEALRAGMREDRFAAAFRESSGLCLPHVRSALTVIDRTSEADDFLSVQRAIWSRLLAQVREYVRKADANHAGDPITAAEATSWRRAVELLAGIAPEPSPRR